MTKGWTPKVLGLFALRPVPLPALPPALICTGGRGSQSQQPVPDGTLKRKGKGEAGVRLPLPLCPG